MSAIDTLGLCAEIAIAMLGFTAIASILNRSDGATLADGRFWGMVSLAFIALACSLLPIPFLYSDAREPNIWAAFSVLLGFSILIALFLTIRNFVKINVRSGAPTNWPILAVFSSLLLAGVALCFYNALAFPESSFDLYIASIIVLHIVAAALFIRLLVVWLGNKESA